VPQNDRAVIGTIPAGVDHLEINLTSANDLDIELWDEKTFVVGWQANGRNSLIYRSTPVSGLYNGVRIAWSGWDGVNGHKGDEYIRISGTTQNAFLMKVYGYQRGAVDVDYRWGSNHSAEVPQPVFTPTQTQAQAPATTPTPQPKPTPATQQPAQKVKTWIGLFDAKWSAAPNWSPIGVPTGDELILIEERLPLADWPILDVDFTLTTGTINIGPVDAMLLVAEGAALTNNGVVNAKGDLVNEGAIVNNGVYNNEAKIVTTAASASFTNNLGGVLNNAAGGSSAGVITNVCGGSINDSGNLGAVAQAPCVWTGAGGNDNWSNPANWANGLVPPENHPVLINGEASASAKVLLDVDLALKSQSLTVGPGDTLTIGSNVIGGHVTLAVKQPGGLLINRGTVAISNYSGLVRDPLATISNVGGTIRNACRGNAPFGGVIGAAVVQDACFWDGGGGTSNWSEAANWDSDTVPTSDDPVLIGNPTSPVSGVTLDASFDLNSLGILTIGEGQTLNVGEGVTLRIANQSPGGSIWVNGVLNLNGGKLISDHNGLITNHGTINIIGGTLTNQGGFLVNESDGQINNVGGLISNEAAATFNNRGSLLNDAASTFLHGDDATLTNSGSFSNAGAFYTSGRGGDITNWQGGNLVNSGTLNQGGLGTFSNLAGSLITNSGRINMLASLFDNRGTVENTGTMEVFHFGSYQNMQGQLENQAGGVFINSGSVTNFSGSTIKNAGSITNNRSLLNEGVISNACGGTVAGSVAGNQPVSICPDG